mgnify:CR=1 FL=1
MKERIALNVDLLSQEDSEKCIQNIVEFISLLNISLLIMKHVLFDLKNCLITPPLDDEEYVKQTLIEAAKVAKLEVLKVDTYKFQPYGVTGYALLAESHISIHTWPEDDLARCDLFSCKPNTDYKSVIQYMQTRFHSMEVKRWACDRSK